MFSVRNKKKNIFELPVSSIHPLIWSSVKLIIYLFKVIICCLLGSTITIAKLSLLLLLCSHSPNDVPAEPQRNISIAAIRGAVHPSIS